MRQVAANHLERGVRQTGSCRELVDAVLHDAGMEVHAGTRLSHGDLRREGDMDAVGMGDFKQHPFGENLPFTQEMLESIKQTLIRVAKERKAAKEAAENGEAPNIAVTNNETAE